MVLPVFVGLIALALSFKLFFPSQGDFLESVKFWFTPDIFSMLRGEFYEDAWAELKMIVWLGTGLAAAFGTFQMLN